MSKKKVTREADDVVLEYLNKQNRPYSAIDVFNNLHKEFGKTAVVKALENLASLAKIVEKTYGKQKVYAAKQDQYGEYDENELKSMDQGIITLTAELSKLQDECKKQESLIGNLNSQFTTEDAKEKLSELTRECEKMQSRIDKIKEEKNPISLEEKDVIYKDNKVFVQHWRKRKRMAMDIVNGILEGYPKKKKDLYEDIGLETDEEAGVSIPST